MLAGHEFFFFTSFTQSHFLQHVAKEEPSQDLNKALFKRVRICGVSYSTWLPSRISIHRYNVGCDWKSLYHQYISGYLCIHCGIVSHHHQVRISSWKFQHPLVQSIRQNSETCHWINALHSMILIACMTGALWAKRGERDMSAKLETRGRQKYKIFFSLPLVSRFALMSRSARNIAFAPLGS